MRNLKAIAVLAGLLMLMVIPAMAEQSLLDSVAVVTDHSGNAKVYTSGAWKNAEINMPLYEGDYIKTAADSAIEVTFDDATIVKLGDNTELKLTELKRQGETATTIFNLLKGKFMAIVDHLRNPESKFEVHTKMAIAAVKGTELAVEADDNNTNLGVYTGSVAFTGANGGSVKGDFKVIVDKGNESGCGGSGILGKPASIKYMGRFEKEFGNLRETVRVVRELKAQGGDAVYRWRIQKKLEKDGKKAGESDTEGTIGGTNRNIKDVQDKIHKALQKRLKREMLNEKSHAWKDLRFITEEMQADLHLGKTMTDVHGNRIRVEEFIHRPNPSQVDLLSLTLREGNRLDYMRIENLFMNPIPVHPTWPQWHSMWQHEWWGAAPANYLTEQRIKLSNIEDWVFLGTSYWPLFTVPGALAHFKLLKQQDIVAVGSGDLPNGGDMTVGNFTTITGGITSATNDLVKEQVMFGYNPASTNSLLAADGLGNQNVKFRGPLDKTYTGPTAYADYVAAQAKFNVTPAPFSTNMVQYTQNTTGADGSVSGDISFKHRRNYNDGTWLMLDLYLINDYGMIQKVPNFNASLDKVIGGVLDILYNSNIEVIVHSSEFKDNVNGIDVVSKLLWSLAITPQNESSATVANW